MWNINKVNNEKYLQVELFDKQQVLQLVWNGDAYQDIWF